ncbi:unnamed protein product [Peniophora sp. CBMAI 1063]|nr:unnamed protein product [Peniophora sp. CBMAI 1063]
MSSVKPIHALSSSTNHISSSTSHVKTVTSPAMRHSPLFSGKIVVYAAGSTLFNVTHSGASNEAKEFEHKFYNPRIPNGPGSSEACPIRLSDSVSATDFTLFLQTLYPGAGPSYVGPVTMENWLTVLRLCHMWNLPLSRTRVVWELEKRFSASLSNSADKIVLGNYYGVHQWVKAGCYALTYRTESLTPEEEDKLSVDLLGKVLKVREKYLSWVVNSMRPIISTQRSTIIAKESIFDFDVAFKNAFGINVEMDLSVQAHVSPFTFIY